MSTSTEAGPSPSVRTDRCCLRAYALRLLVFLLAAFGLHTVQAQSTLLPGQSGPYFDPARVGEGVFVELLSQGRALVYVASYEQAHVVTFGQARQTWMIGVGEQVGDSIRIEELFRPLGGRFGAMHSSAAENTLTLFGSLALRIPVCGSDASRGGLDIRTVDGSGFEDIVSDNYVQLAQLVGCDTDDRAANFIYSGSWFDPLGENEGWLVHVLEDGRALVMWFTYTETGDQLWAQGIGEFDGSTLRVDELNRYAGTRWAQNFEADRVEAVPLGRLEIEFTSCSTAILQYETVELGAGTQSIEHLTELMGINEGGAGCWDY